jgi:hypothetical protein
MDNRDTANILLESGYVMWILPPKLMQQVMDLDIAHEVSPLD